jgi:cytochrome c peroxidase
MYTMNTLLSGVLLVIPLSGPVQCGFAGPDESSEEVPADALDDLLTDALADVPADVRHGDLPAFLGFLNPTVSLEQLGKFVFFDKISSPRVIGCASCHEPAAGWTFRDDKVNRKQVAAPGAVPHAVGTIKPPTNAYAHLIPPFQTTCASLPLPLPCGGVFWDGRAEGNAASAAPGATAHVGDEVFKGKSILKTLYRRFLGPLADQALQPFPNEVEQNISEKQVCKHVAKSIYAPLYLLAWGEWIDCSNKGYKISFERLAVALAAWQSSAEVNSFSSKRDLALEADADGEFPLDDLTAKENLGHDLFYSTFQNPATFDGTVKITNCALCHSDDPINDNGTEIDQLYTDNAFHNIGVPPNPEIPGDPGSPGLGGRTGNVDHLGLHKTPTLRNVDKRPKKSFVKAYTHNGWFKSLESLVHFYNTADVSSNGLTAASFGITPCDANQTWTEAAARAANCWPAPEETGTLAIGALIGNMGLTLEEEAALVAYLKTLSDLKTVKPPKLLK